MNVLLPIIIEKMGDAQLDVEDLRHEKVAQHQKGFHEVPWMIGELLEKTMKVNLRSHKYSEL